jgi:NitT/TauT family transport system permease protein
MKNEQKKAHHGWDLLAGLLAFGLIAFFAESSRELIAPLATLDVFPVSLDPARLPGYAARTTFRMFAALGLSLCFTFTYATLAAKSRRAERLLVPLLDILQSIPILGFISVTVVFFMSLAPGRVLGAELAAIFAIFTSQAWNMAFSFYQSLRTVPAELTEAASSFRLSTWMRFWRVDVPFAMPQLVWNMMMSMSGGWFFVVASEAISVGDTRVTLPGIGSYIALAIEQRDLGAVAWAVGTMFVVILLYDQLFFRPLVAWTERFRVEQESGVAPGRSWVLDILRRSPASTAMTASLSRLWRRSYRITAVRAGPALGHGTPHWVDYAWNATLLVAVVLALWQVGRFILSGVSPTEVGTAFLLGLVTLVRIAVLIAVATLIWVPIGVWIGMRPNVARIAQPIAQFLAAFPANLLFPFFVSGIVVLRLNPDVWLSPLMIMGTQWYILFNVIAGASAMPSDLRYASANLRVRGLLWWRRIGLPAVFPYYLTGAITASGGSWNASIVAEVATWGQTRLEAHGIGAYIARATEGARFHQVVLGVAVMSVFVVAVNRLFWRPVYRYAERRFRLA